MKSAAKIIKSLHVESENVSTMFFGYFILFAVSVSIIFGSGKATQEEIASKEIKTEQTNIN